MARPSKFNREEAINFAMNEIWRDGYEANSVKALSEKLGITRSSFYNAFGNRAALFREVLKLYFSQTPDRKFREECADVSVKRIFTDTFRAVCKARSKDKEARGCLAVNCISELCNTNSELGPLLEEAVLGNVELLIQGISTGELEDDIDPRILALSVQNLLIGLNVLCKVVRKNSDLWHVARVTLQGLGLLEET